MFALVQLFGDHLHFMPVGRVTSAILVLPAVRCPLSCTSGDHLHLIGARRSDVCCCFLFASRDLARLVSALARFWDLLGMLFYIAQALRTYLSASGAHWPFCAARTHEGVYTSKPCGADRPPTGRQIGGPTRFLPLLWRWENSERPKSN